MKYYAVTEDPNELMHYGVKGMKWGQHIFGDKPKSAAYKRAAGKLSSSMRNGIAKARANWKTAHSPSALRAKARIKEAKMMKKALQQAREGRLRYGKLTDEQVRQVTARLALEQQARNLGGKERSNLVRRYMAAKGEGILQGITKGTASYMDEIYKAKGKVKAKRRYGETIARQEAREAGIKQAQTKISNERETKHAKRVEDIKQKAANTAKNAAKKTGATIWRGVKNAAGKRRDKRATYRIRRKRSYPYAYTLGSGEYRIT